MAARTALAEVKRYAFLIGSNRGQSQQPPLRYAEADVDAMAETLSRLGDFRSERIVRLLAPTASRVRNALVDLNLAIQAEVRAGNEAVLFVYYSGHADGRDLHLGGTDLPTDELSKLVRLSPAKLKVLLLDACRSGALTRVKGGRQVAPFQIGVESRLRNEGYAIITSSSAGEDAQESDALRSSIFTHHFLTALRGPGDRNGDRQVTLGEAYSYAYEQSLKASMTTVVGSQHATFDYDLRGRADPVLTDLRQIGDQSRIVFTAAGDYLVMSAETEAVLVEANVRSPQTIALVPAARYRIRMRTRDSVFQGEITARPGKSADVGSETLRPIPFAQVVRKGHTEASVAQGPTVNGIVHGPLGDGFSAMFGAQLGWAIELPRVTLMPRFGWSTGRANDLPPGVVTHAVRELSVDLAGLYVVDMGRLSVAPLVSVGWAFLRQTIDRGSGCLPEPCRETTRPQGLVTTVGAWTMWPVGRGLSVEASLELANYTLRRQEARDGLEAQPPRIGSLTYRGGIGVGYRY